MKGFLGEFEELVLLTIAALDEEAYGVAIKDALEQSANRKISTGALHSTITRLEDKGFLKSWLGGATSSRGGRRKRFFEITHSGTAALHSVKELRDQLWENAKTNLSAGI